jgi:pimeloyl-ACP methyl ester carboxylesterase
MKGISIILILCLSTLLSGCMFKDLKEELAEFDQSYVIAGKVSNQEQATGPVLVILYSHAESQKTAQQIVFTEATGDFSFLVHPGIYSLAAFADANSNMAWDMGESAGRYGAPDEIDIPSQTAAGLSNDGNVTGLKMDLKPPGETLSEAPALDDTSLSEAKSLVRLGTVAKLDDSIFIQENGSLGYWKPATFLKKLGFGIYFMEPFEPEKIPVLFVHGAVGTPIGFSAMVEAMDRDHFQPWFFYYPSGVRLTSVVEALKETVVMLRNAYPFDTLLVTAHSMGGLVSRAFVIDYLQTESPASIKLLVSISTPWGGSRMAAKGAKNAPVAVPSWYDMDPDSDFIQHLYTTPLPMGVSHHLFFGFKGDCSLFMANNDGTVELESELDYRAQREARTTIGLNEDHMSILESHELINEYNRILSTLVHGADKR